MNARKSSMMAVIAAALLAPALSMADSPWVPANNNRGYTYQPDHGSAAGVQGRSVGSAAAPSALLREGAPQDTTPSATGKTREQVRSEFLNMSAAEKQQWRELNRN
ncbi:hypothetical protein [Azohydromonas lata]|uniref:hypothetical protein n=1 Tax=Azohydromonas lata TaxID=45677 RepID=UPI0012F4F6ED|nr:hypothetical protein [Azohydromonas lata]